MADGGREGGNRSQGVLVAVVQAVPSSTYGQQLQAVAGGPLLRSWGGVQFTPVPVRLQPLAGTRLQYLRATARPFEALQNSRRCTPGQGQGRASTGHRQGPGRVEAQHEEVPGARGPGTLLSTAATLCRESAKLQQRLPASKSPASGGPQQRCEPGSRLADVWSLEFSQASSVQVCSVPGRSTLRDLFRYLRRQAKRRARAAPRSFQPNAAGLSLAVPGPSTQRYLAGGRVTFHSNSARSLLLVLPK
ncbi:hypothetical protein BBK36DRAFT_1138980 [Trichoderma citrinoviride]|uniref:Uncharacterized protein n=1 Tax=Trichoderma citrinoviride TaxID=58853 RepID=A0A2T4BHY5_9HYPO|nr:hypothetical protein BBK36DRAFT_1138980 [Trichoderma citrinoviride]PTB68888.1 hypothetical protein BBK36DRAFT_1138980 [Trichoderma citrinoviride]